MKPITFSAPFKPSGIQYTKLSMWNRYIHNPLRLISIFLPTVLGIYFLLTSSIKYLVPVYILILFYPLFHVIWFYIKIQKHLKFRSQSDEVTANFTIMDNGILVERPEVDINHLYHWEDFTHFFDIKDFMLLYKDMKLSLVLLKEYMPEDELSNIKNVISEHVSPQNALKQN